MSQTASKYSSIVDFFFTLIFLRWPRPSQKLYVISRNSFFTFSVSELLIKKNQILTFNILFLYKSAYSYHGVAFIESILSRIIFHFSVFGLYFAFCKKGIAIVVGKDNYENGNIALNFKTIPFPSLNKLEIELIGGLSDYDSVSYRFLDLKRLGLKILIDNFLKKSNKLISLKQGFNQYRKSKMINLLGEGLKKLIKLIKDNI